MRTIIAAFVLLSSSALAEHPQEPTPNDPSAIAIAGAASSATAGAAAGVYAPIDIDIAVEGTPAPGAAQPIDVSADGGDSHSESSADNAVTVVQQHNYRRNAPSLAQGGLAVAGCGAGANGGGSREGGAGFLGLVWTTDQCYQLLAASAFAAIGMPDTSCDLLVSMKSVQKAFKRAGKPLPDCLTAENRDLATAAAEITHGLTAIERMNQPAKKCPECATKQELERAFKKSNEK